MNLPDTEVIKAMFKDKDYISVIFTLITVSSTPISIVYYMVTGDKKMAVSLFGLLTSFFFGVTIFYRAWFSANKEMAEPHKDPNSHR